MRESFPEQSRDRLLQAALEVFAEKGYQGAKVRDICSRADANVAAVNYYFRNKEGLYGEALAFAFRQAEQRYPMTDAANRALPAEQRLQQFVRVFLLRILDDSELGHHGKLVAREIAEPTNALDNVVNTVISPMFNLLADIVPQLTPVPLETNRLQRCMLSIVGQCVMFKHSRPIIDRLCPHLIANASEVEQCAAHIAQFSLLAIRHLDSPSAEAVA